MADLAVHCVIMGGRRTGKTERLTRLLRTYSEQSIPVFVCDTKAEVAGLLAAAPDEETLPLVLWDVYGERGIPLRTSVTDLGPLLMARILDLNALQEGVLRICFRLEDEHGYLLLDLEDLQAVITYIAAHSGEIAEHYGQISAATLGAISRRILAVQDEHGDRFFGEPALEIHDLLRCEGNLGCINILDAERLHTKRNLYSGVLLWLLSALIEELDDTRDEEIRLVFAIDRAEQLLAGANATLADQLAPLLRQARRKGIKIILVLDDAEVLEKNIRDEIEEWFDGAGKREQGVQNRRLPEIDRQSKLFRKYAKTINRHSAKEILEVRMESMRNAKAEEQQQAEKKKRYPLLQKMTNSAVTTIGREIGKQIMRGVMGVFKR